MIPSHHILLIECRNMAKKKVSFSALNALTGTFFWKDVVFDEPWWISLNAAAGGMALFTVYVGTDNPDKKGIFAYDVFEKKITWWNNDFSLIAVNDEFVKGVASKYGHREVMLALPSGLPVPDTTSFVLMPDPVVRPSQYAEGHEHFNTLKNFLATKFNLPVVAALEYIEHESAIFISLYVAEPELTNYLMILSSAGIVLREEKLDEHLKGIGLDTFFLYAGCVFFVKNKRELFSYKIV
ncbi:MAG: DUF4905 domain-containing protein [Chryseolinea sp.]